MKTGRLIIPCAIFSLFMLAAAVPAGEEPPPPAPDMAAAVAEAVRGAEDLPPDRLWECAARMGLLPRTADDALQQALAGAGPKTRLVLARELGERGNQETGARALLKLVGSDADEELRVYAANSLGRLTGLVGARWLLDDMAEAAAAEKSTLVRVALNGSRGRLGDDGAAADALLEIMRTEQGTARKEAALALGNIGRAALPEVRQELLLIYRNDPTFRSERAISVYRNSLTRDPLFAEVLQAVTEYYDAEKDETLDRHKLVQSAVRGMVSDLDPFSAFMDAEEGAELKETLTGEYGGIGAYVNLVDGVFTIISPIYGGPADKAGLRSMDRVLEVDGVKTTTETMTKTISRLKGQPGTQVKAKIFRRGWREPREFTITRDMISVDSVVWEMLPAGVGYARVIRFAPEKTITELRAAIAAMKAQGMRGMILDLRDNPGGYLTAAVDLANEFLPADKLIVSSRGRRVRPAEYRSDGTGSLKELPLTVLVNSGSASASEILAAALRDHGRAKLIGEKTYGKGSVQEQLQLRSEPGATLKLTVAKYYVPSGECVHEKGIVPDVEEASEDQVTPGWKYEEVAKVIDRLDEWTAEAYKGNPEAFRALAEDDGGDASRYPGLSEFVNGLKESAHITAEDARPYVRRVVRRMAADDRNKRYATNMEDDRQLKRAALILLEAVVGADKQMPAPYDRYARVFQDEAKLREASAAGKIGLPGPAEE